jgi:hypothetical protein
MKESFRDKTRDALATNLNAIGVRAEMIERGAIAEKIEDSWYKRSLGIINIPEGPIRWINILKRDRSQHNPRPRWWVVLGIPDYSPPIPRHGNKIEKIKIKAVREKTFPLFGKVVEVKWNGNDGGTGLLDVLNRDEAVKTLSLHLGNLGVKRHIKGFQGWTLTVDRKITPTNKDWKTIVQISDYLRSHPRSLS